MSCDSLRVAAAPDTPEDEEKFFAKTRKAIMVALAHHLDKVNRSMTIRGQSNAVIVIVRDHSHASHRTRHRLVPAARNTPDCVCRV